MSHAPTDTKYLDVARFVEVAGKSNEAVRPFAPLAVQIWHHHRLQHNGPAIPALSATVSGDTCDVCFFGTSQCDTDKLQKMVDDINQFATRCTDVTFDAEHDTTVYSLSRDPVPGCIANVRPMGSFADSEIVFTASTCSIAAERLDRLARVVASSKGRMDRLEIQMSSSSASEVHIGPIPQCSARMLLQIARDPSVRADRVTFVRMADGTGYVKCNMLAPESTDEPESTWGKIMRLVGRGKRRMNRASRGDAPY
jgi:hypothetical protein